MNKKIFSLLAIALSFGVLSGCGPKDDPGANTQDDGKIVLDNPDELVSTPITDSFNLPQANELEGKKFAHKVNETSDHIGYVSLRSCTDGDTANFIQEGYKDDTNSYITIKTRFLGINTPESTAKVEPWGKKASIFTKKVLTEAQENADSESARVGHKVFNIVLINSLAIHEERDTAGNRWLAYVWYRKTSASQWRLLNLELVEQAYSSNQLFVADSTNFCNYKAKFEAAEARVKASKVRVHGTKDPDYDYENTPYEYSLWYIIHHYDEIGITEQGSSGVQLIVTALVVGTQGDNLYLRDVLLDNEQVEAGDMQYAGLYAYCGFNKSIVGYIQNVTKSLQMNDNGLGIIARFYCRAGIYSGNVQLTDVIGSGYGRQSMDFITDDQDLAKYKTDYKWSYTYVQNNDLTFADLNTNIDSVRMDPATLSDYDDPATPDVKYDDLLKYQYQFINTEVKIRSVTATDYDDDGTAAGAGASYWAKLTADSKAYTVYAEITGKNNSRILTNLRVDAALYPFIETTFFGDTSVNDLDGPKSPVGKTFHVTGYLCLYFEKFQIQLPNNYRNMNYIYEVK